MDQFTKTIITIPDNWLDHIGAIVGKGGKNIHDIRNFAAPQGKGIKIFVTKNANGRSVIEISTFTNDSGAQGKIMRATHRFEDLFRKEPGMKPAQKKASGPSMTQSSTNRFVVEQQLDKDPDKGIIDWSDDDSSEDEDEPVAPQQKAVSPIRIKRFTKKKQESDTVDDIMAQNGLTEEPKIERFVTN